jgi:DNA-binding Lrp family transcriptional regulator
MKKKKKQRLVTLASQEHQELDEVRPNDHLVLDAFNEKSEYTFRGIMRKIGMHQETLSRSLRRLVELGLIDKSDLGYRISPKTQNLPKKKTHNFTPILMSYLPPSLGGKMIDKIAGSWFGGLRWVGISNDEGQQTLQWLNGLFYVNLKVLPNHIIIETNANNEKDKVDAMNAAFRIIQKITELYDPSVKIDDLTN